MGTNLKMPPGNYVLELGGFKVGAPFKNHFNRKAKVVELFLCADGRQILIYEDERGGVGQQLINQDWIRTAAK